MLQSLHVTNLALIDEVEINFGEKLNILTGETGTGKSILIGSIEGILGKKISKDMIRPGANQAVIELLFSTENQNALDYLKEQDILVEDGQVIIKRVIDEKKNVNRINDVTVTLNTMREFTTRLIDLHGQHQHQTLLNEKKQLDILDHFLPEKAKKDVEQLSVIFHEYKKIEEKQKEFLLDEQERLREISFLEHEAEEIETAGLSLGEDEELEEVYQKMLHGKDIIEVCADIYKSTGYEEEHSVGTLLGESMRKLQNISNLDTDLNPFYEQLLEIEDLFQGFHQELSEYMDRMNFDEEVYHETEERLNTINRLKAKYGNTIQEILQYENECKDKLNSLRNYEEEKIKHEELFLKTKEQYMKLARKVTKARKESAKLIGDNIKNALIDLNFIQVEFVIDVIEREEMLSNGLNQVSFLISTNPGLPLRPIKDVASGGELSRIMLAMKSVLADVDQVETLVFDEIDVGISGETANKVAKRMAVLARGHQVIAITHLPQIAAMADDHFGIEKTSDGKQTTTSISLLSSEDSLNEVARMIGGDDLTKTSIQSAKEMKSLAMESKLY
ncbi:MAG: DNA repair protein RecN [Anaerostipes sp.]|jgi:DNA repair protein RecN (Recombination protein N)